MLAKAVQSVPNISAIFIRDVPIIGLAVQLVGDTNH